jgi:hypothetical protein
MITAILFMLIGVALGQYIKIHVSPDLIDFLESAFNWGRGEALPKSGDFVEEIIEKLRIKRNMPIDSEPPLKPVGKVKPESPIQIFTIGGQDE